jgi:hypothetical protein
MSKRRKAGISPRPTIKYGDWDLMIPLVGNMTLVRGTTWFLSRDKSWTVYGGLLLPPFFFSRTLKAVKFNIGGSRRDDEAILHAPSYADGYGGGGWL